MKKVGVGMGGVLVALSPDEFSALSGKSYTGVPDGSDISLSRVQKLNDFMGERKAQLAALYKNVKDVKVTLEGLTNGK